MLTINIEKRLGQLQLKVDTQLPLQGVTAVLAARVPVKPARSWTYSAGFSTPDSGEIRLGDKLLYQQGKVNLPQRSAILAMYFKRHGCFHTIAWRQSQLRCVKPTQCYSIKLCSYWELKNCSVGIPARYRAAKTTVAIGRALLTSPDMLLMDEPAGVTRFTRKRELPPYLQTLSQELKLPIVYVEPQPDEILQLADYMLVLHQGKIDRPRRLKWSVE